MSEDIVERLSAQIESHENWEKIGGTGWETAHADLRDARDEIERLRAELARFVPTNDECLSDDGMTASQAWRRT